MVIKCICRIIIIESVKWIQRRVALPFFKKQYLLGILNNRGSCNCLNFHVTCHLIDNKAALICHQQMNEDFDLMGLVRSFPMIVSMNQFLHLDDIVPWAQHYDFDLDNIYDQIYFCINKERVKMASKYYLIKESTVNMIRQARS